MRRTKQPKLLPVLFPVVLKRSFLNSNKTEEQARGIRCHGGHSFNVLCLLIFLALSTGCEIPVRGEKGTTHHVIIGIGVVSTSPKSDGKDIPCMKVEALGFMFSDQPSAKLTTSLTYS